jgi:hypothetical protein
MQTASKIRFSYLALAITGCIAAWCFRNAARGVHQTMEIAHMLVTNGFALVMDYGFLLYLIPVGLACLCLASSKVPLLQEAIVFAVVGSAMALTYVFTSYLLLTPFIHGHVQIKRANPAAPGNDAMSRLFHTEHPCRAVPEQHCWTLRRSQSSSRAEGNSLC